MLEAQKDSIKSQAKRILKKNKPTSKEIWKEIEENLIAQFNELTRTAAKAYVEADRVEDEGAKTAIKLDVGLKFKYCRGLVVRSFKELQLRYLVPKKLNQLIDKSIVLEVNTEYSDQSASPSDQEDESSTEKTTIRPDQTKETITIPAQTDSPGRKNMDHLAIMKMVDSAVKPYGGEENNLTAWENQVQLVKSISQTFGADEQAFILQILKSKLTGTVANCVSDAEGTLDQLAAKVRANVIKNDSTFYEHLLESTKQQQNETTIDFIKRIDQSAVSLRRMYEVEQGSNSRDPTAPQRRVVKLLRKNLAKHAIDGRVKQSMQLSNFSTIEEVLTKVGEYPIVDAQEYTAKVQRAYNKGRWRSGRDRRGRDDYRGGNGYRGKHDNRKRGFKKFGGDRNKRRDGDGDKWKAGKNKKWDKKKVNKVEEQEGAEADEQYSSDEGN